MKAKRQPRAASKPRTWRGWATVYANCKNVQLTLYASKRDALEDDPQFGDELIRVEVREIKG